MFPIHDRRGRVIGFGGRVLGDDTPKYLNSPETPVFHKGRELYGLFRGTQTRAQAGTAAGGGRLYGCGRAGPVRYRQCCRNIGHRHTREHLELLYSRGARSVFCFDGDRAGRAAAWRALENALPILRMAARPASCFCLTGKIRIRWYAKKVRRPSNDELASPSHFPSICLKPLSAKVDNLSSMDGRARLVELAKPMLEQLPTGVFQRMLVDRLENWRACRGNALAEMHGQPIQPTLATPTATAQRGGISPVRRLMTLLLQEPALARLVKEPKSSRQP